MIVLVINAGSSSVKFTLFDIDNNKQVLANGLIERIGIEGTSMKYSNHKGEKFQQPVPVKNPTDAVKVIAEYLVDAKYGVLSNLSAINAIGHRIVHGMEKISKPVLLTKEAKDIVRECFSLSPLHNPHNLAGIEACEAVLPGVPNVGVFDTAFHATMQPHVYLYAIPYKWYTDEHIRRYGFHGTSHEYVSKAAAAFDGRPLKDLRIITCHLGNGASVSAVKGGECQDTSMGLTPLEGLIMGTRSGDLDPAVVLHIMKLTGKSPQELDTLLNKESGVLGIGGIGSSDLRDIEEAAGKGNKQCETALKMFAYRVRKYIGAYIASLGGLDILVFTAGAGENSSTLRAGILEGLEGIGFKLCPKKNSERSSEIRAISKDDSPIKILVVPTNEELAIAEFTTELLKNKA
ncbi:MAG: acetate kinase [Deltaproteobacteria bacterium]|jgi:acetate kinase|nr:acetate kinase [Deltaproteobacteria bacterium]